MVRTYLNSVINFTHAAVKKSVEQECSLLLIITIYMSNPRMVIQRLSWIWANITPFILKSVRILFFPLDSVVEYCARQNFFGWLCCRDHTDLFRRWLFFVIRVRISSIGVFATTSFSVNVSADLERLVIALRMNVANEEKKTKIGMKYCKILHLSIRVQPILLQKIIIMLYFSVTAKPVLG